MLGCSSFGEICVLRVSQAGLGSFSDMVSLVQSEVMSDVVMFSLIPFLHLSKVAQCWR